MILYDKNGLIYAGCLPHCSMSSESRRLNLTILFSHSEHERLFMDTQFVELHTLRKIFIKLN